MGNRSDRKKPTRAEKITAANDRKRENAMMDKGKRQGYEKRQAKESR